MVSPPPRRPTCPARAAACSSTTRPAARSHSKTSSSRATRRSGPPERSAVPGRPGWWRHLISRAVPAPNSTFPAPVSYDDVYGGAGGTGLGAVATLNGRGHSGGAGGNALGAGLYASGGNVQLNNDTFSNNLAEPAPARRWEWHLCQPQQHAGRRRHWRDGRASQRGPVLLRQDGPARVRHLLQQQRVAGAGGAGGLGHTAGTGHAPWRAGLVGPVVPPSAGRLPVSAAHSLPTTRCSTRTSLRPVWVASVAPASSASRQPMSS